MRVPRKTVESKAVIAVVKSLDPKRERTIRRTVLFDDRHDELLQEGSMADCE